MSIRFNYLESSCCDVTDNNVAFGNGINSANNKTKMLLSRFVIFFFCYLF